MGSLEEQFAEMLIKVKNLSCHGCYKKVDNILHKFPEIRDRAYNEGARTVTVAVNCYDIESLRDRLIQKGRGFIQHIEIKEPEKKEDEEEDDKKKKKKKKKQLTGDLTICCDGQFSNAPSYDVRFPSTHMSFGGSGTYAGRNYYYQGLGTCLDEENTERCIIM